MIFCDICHKPMQTDGEGKVPLIYISNWSAKHACPPCKYQWQTTLERLRSDRQRRAYAEESEAWLKFCGEVQSTETKEMK